MFHRPSAGLFILAVCLAISFPFSSTIAQNTLPDSKVALTAGIEQYDKDNYKAAITEFLKVPEGDTNYTDVRYELALAYLADSAFDKALHTVRDGLALYHCSNRRGFNLLLGHCYDYLGKTDSAIAVYQALAKENPNDHQPLYELGVVYFQQKKYDDAIALWQKALLVNPNHFRSHQMLGSAYLLQGRMTEAFLALETSLAVANDVALARKSITLLDELARQTETVSQPFSAKDKRYQHPLFDEIDEIMHARLALDKAYKVKSVLGDDNLIRVAYMVSEKLNYKPSDTNFVMQYYVPMYRQVFEKDLFDPYILFLFSGFNIDVVEKYVKKQKGDIKDIKQLGYDYYNRILSTRELNFEKRQKAADKYYFETGSNVYISGNLQVVEGKLSFKAGPVKYYKNGVLTAEGDYNNDNKKNGEWHYYYTSGVMRMKEHYDNGKLIGENFRYYGSGYPSYAEIYNAANEVVETRDYDYYGFLTEKNSFENSVKTSTSYYRNGQQNLVLRMKDDKPVDGAYTMLYENGNTRRQVSVVNGKLSGAYKDFFENGQVKEEGNYRNGDREGLITTYNEDGSLHWKLNYGADKLEGPFEEYDTRGQLKSKGTYRNGKKTDIETLYHDNTEYGSIEYRNDKIVGYKFVNPAGKVVESKNDRDLNFVRLYYPNGMKRVEAPLKDGLYEGSVKFYFSTGALKERAVYHADQPDGVNSEYYKSGKLNNESVYVGGKRTGWYNGYYENGALRGHGWLIDGKKEGLWQFFNSNGTLDEESFHLDGELNGPRKQFYNNGKVSYIDYFDNGMLIAAEHFDTSGVRIRRQDFDGGNGTYESFWNNGEKAFTCPVKNGLLHGTMVKYFYNGSLSEKIEMRFGKREGLYEGFGQNGKLTATGLYVDGEKDGRWRYYSESGALDRSTGYKNGEEHGTDTVFYGNGSFVAYNMIADYKDGDQIYFGDSGHVAVILRYKDQDLVGYTYYDRDGKLKPIIPLEKGTGTVTAFYANGNKSAVFSFVENLFEGMQTLYFPNGKESEVRMLKNKDFNGPYKRYFASGKLMYEATYKDDVLTGNEKYYSADGTLERSSDYYWGQLHGLVQRKDASSGKTTTTRYYCGSPIGEQ